MDVLKRELQRKRQQLEADFDGRKVIRRAEIEAREIQRLRVAERERLLQKQQRQHEQQPAAAPVLPPRRLPLRVFLLLLVTSIRRRRRVSEGRPRGRSEGVAAPEGGGRPAAAAAAPAGHALRRGRRRAPPPPPRRARGPRRGRGHRGRRGNRRGADKRLPPRHPGLACQGDGEAQGGRRGREERLRRDSGEGRGGAVRGSVRRGQDHGLLQEAAERVEPGGGRDARGGAADGQGQGRGGHLQAVRALPRPALQALQEEGSPKRRPASAARRGQVLHAAGLPGGDGQLHQARDRQLAVADRGDHGGHPRAVRPGEDPRQRRGPRDERRDHQEVPAVREAAHDLLPAEVPHGPVQVGRVQQPGQRQRPAGSPGREERRQEFGRNASVGGCVVTAF